MGLKGYRLWVMGQLDSTCRAPPSPLLAPSTKILSHDRKYLLIDSLHFSATAAPMTQLNPRKAATPSR
jgi:hypothetical protein